MVVERIDYWHEYRGFLARPAELVTQGSGLDEKIHDMRIEFRRVGLRLFFWFRPAGH
jgi:hypothetical protein